MKNYIVKNITKKITKSNIINLLPVYYIPLKKDVIVIMCFFNPANSIRLVQNFLYVLQLLNNATIPVVVIELSYSNTFITNKNDTTNIVIQLKTNSIMFHKENLLNIAINKVKHMYKKFVLLDADIIFEDLNWYSNTSNLLDQYEVLQLFDYAKWMTLNMKNVYQTQVSSCYFTLNKNIKMKPHPGFVWAITLSAFNKLNGIPDLFPVGSNDTLLAYLATGIQLHKNVIDNRATLVFSNEINKDKEFTFYYLKSCVYHLFHGKQNKRKYRERFEEFNELLERLNINDYSYISKNKDGLYEWKEEYRDILNHFCLNYFVEREDDSY